MEPINKQLDTIAEYIYKVGSNNIVSLAFASFKACIESTLVHMNDMYDDESSIYGSGEQIIQNLGLMVEYKSDINSRLMTSSDVETIRELAVITNIMNGIIHELTLEFIKRLRSIGHEHLR